MARSKTSSSTRRSSSNKASQGGKTRKERPSFQDLAHDAEEEEEDIDEILSERHPRTRNSVKREPLDFPPPTASSLAPSNSDADSIEKSSIHSPRVKVEMKDSPDLYNVTPLPRPSQASNVPKRSMSKSSRQLTTPVASPSVKPEKCLTGQPGRIIKSEFDEERWTREETSLTLNTPPRSSPDRPKLSRSKKMSRAQTDSSLTNKGKVNGGGVKTNVRRVEPPAILPPLKPTRPKDHPPILPPTKVSQPVSKSSSKGPESSGSVSNPKAIMSKIKSEPKSEDDRDLTAAGYVKNAPKSEYRRPKSGSRSHKGNPNNKLLQTRPCHECGQQSSHNKKRNTKHERHDTYHEDEILNSVEGNSSWITGGDAKKKTATQRRSQMAVVTLRGCKRERTVQSGEYIHHQSCLSGRAHGLAVESWLSSDEEDSGGEEEDEDEEDDDEEVVDKRTGRGCKAESKWKGTSEIKGPTQQRKRSWESHNDGQTLNDEECLQSDDDVVEIVREVFEQSERRKRKKNPKTKDSRPQDLSRRTREPSKEENDTNTDCSHSHAGSPDFASTTPTRSDNEDEAMPECNFDMHPYFEHGIDNENRRAHDGFIDYQGYKRYCNSHSLSDDGLRLRYRRDLKHFLDCKRHQQQQPRLHVVAYFASKNPMFSLKSNAATEEMQRTENEAIGFDPDEMGRRSRRRGRVVEADGDGELRDERSLSSDWDLEGMMREIRNYAEALAEMKAKTRRMEKEWEREQKRWRERV